LSSLKEGALVIDVRMRRNDSSLPFIDENLLSRMILKMLMDEESADVVFKIKAGDDQEASMFYDHHLVMEK